MLRDGNLLTLPNVTLEVNDACSGIRSLMALISITALVGYLSESRLSRRALIVLAAVPLAIGLNGVRTPSPEWSSCSCFRGIVFS